MNEKEMLMKQLRANAFPHNNGKVMQAINIIRHSYPSFDLPASPCCMARPEVSGAGGVHQGNAADEIPP